LVDNLVRIARIYLIQIFITLVVKLLIVFIQNHGKRRVTFYKKRDRGEEGREEKNLRC